MTYRDDEVTRPAFSLAHLALVVADADRSADFYARVIGCGIGDQVVTDNLKIIYLQSGGLTLELLQYIPAPPVQRGAGFFDHLAFTVPNIEAATQQLREQGVRFESEAPRLAPTGHKIIFCAGPDGERIELMEEQ